jgi:hypothetical protein
MVNMKNKNKNKKNAAGVLFVLSNGAELPKRTALGLDRNS